MELVKQSSPIVVREPRKDAEGSSAGSGWSLEQTTMTSPALFTLRRYSMSPDNILLDTDALIIHKQDVPTLLNALKRIAQ